MSKTQQEIENKMSNEQKEYLKNKQNEKSLILFLQVMLVVIFFLLWEVSANLKLIDPFIFSQPTKILNAMYYLLEEGILLNHVYVTCYEVVIGFLLGTILGTIIALVLWWSPFISRVLEPYLVILNSLPKTALAPIIIVWLGNGTISIIAIALLTSIIVTIMNVLNGFLGVDSERIKLIRVLGGTKWQVLTKVVLPSNVSCILNALKVNVGLSFVGVMVGEFLVGKAGLGYLINYGSQVFKLDWVMLSILILCVIATFFYQAIGLLEKVYKVEE